MISIEKSGVKRKLDSIQEDDTLVKTKIKRGSKLKVSKSEPISRKPKTEPRIGVDSIQENDTLVKTEIKIERKLKALKSEPISRKPKTEPHIGVDSIQENDTLVKTEIKREHKLKAPESEPISRKPKTEPRIGVDSIQENDTLVKTEIKRERKLKTPKSEPISRKPKIDSHVGVDMLTASVSATADDSQDDKAKLWEEVEMLSLIANIPESLGNSFVKLIMEGCTLPFIARYRKAAVNNLTPNRLQELFETYQKVCHLKKKVETAINTLKKSDKLTPEIENSILNASNISELDLVCAPFKSHSLTLAEKARQLGLESHAVRALNGEYIELKSLCNLQEDGLSTIEKVDAHITHIIADIIYKDPRVLKEMRKLKTECRFLIQSSRSKSSLKTKEESSGKYDSKSDPETYKLYFDWKCPVHFVKPHQTLALNRGEDEKILAVKVIIPDWFYHKLESFCLMSWKSSFWVKKGLNDAYTRLIKPWLSRQVRSDLTSAAQKEAISTFITNLEKYLLTEPIKNRRIAGLDPGFRAGCKIGIIETDGQNLHTCTIYPDFRASHDDPAAKELKELLLKFSVSLIGLGNGTACRETEAWLKKHNIQNETIPVIIVPEQGASIYSVSKEAQKEHPNLDPNHISALSIARRVLDPMGELIKVDPKHLGVGLYQHDIPTKSLDAALDLAVEKVVSLVGVDINTASKALLSHVAGLSEARATKIINHRSKIGRFTSRADILKVTGIGKITYQQCAGFLKVLDGTEPLDATIIHPESYDIAKMFAKKIHVNMKEINQPHFTDIVQNALSNVDLQILSQELKTDVCTMELIVNAFKKKNNEDDIIKFSKPLYSLEVQAVRQLREGMSLTGVVRNVVPFGCFVDCGIGDNGLLHNSNIRGQTPRLGDRILVTVIGEPKPKKIQLRLEKILE